MVKRSGRITLEERKKLAAWYAKGVSVMDIASRLRLHVRTIYRELKRGYTGEEGENSRPVYDPKVAQEVTDANYRRVGRPLKRGKE